MHASFPRWSAILCTRGENFRIIKLYVHGYLVTCYICTETLHNTGCISSYTHTHTYTHTRTTTHTHIHTIHTYTHNTHIHIHAHNTHIHTYMHTIHTYTHTIHTYTHTYTHECRHRHTKDPHVLKHLTLQP